MKTTLLLTVLTFTLLGCADSEKINPTQLLPATGINLSNPEVGQAIHYLRYESNCNENDFKFSGDTLTAEIIDDKCLLYLKEYFTAGSVIEADTSFTQLENTMVTS